VDEIVAAVGDAMDAQVAVELRYSFGRCGFGTNRRRPTPEGFELGPYPDGPVDTTVPVLVARRGDAVRAVLFGYACHPTSFPPRTEFHPDWPGVAATELEKRHPDATALFLQGCSADQNPYPRNTIEWTEQHGRTMALAVEAAIEADGRRIDGPLRTASETVQLRFTDQPDREEFERRVAADERDRYAKRCLAELDERGELRTEFPYPVASVGFGDDLTLLALGGEVPVSVASALQSRFDGDVWVAGCSNLGYLYLPTSRMLVEGGYESQWVFLYWRYPAPLAGDCADRVLDVSTALAQRVGATRREGGS
jgi:hypothetical protein